tara:strand:+ start:142 stop:390 length:249 start_codon:yes stop_codon:yes gene_type:complete
MIANLIGGFVAVLVGVVLVGPISTETNLAWCGTNFSNCDSALYNVSGWGSTVLRMVPGFFALSVMGIGIAITYASLRQAGIV